MLSTLTDKEIDEFLMAHKIGNIGCCLNEKPYVFPMAYVYHEDVIYGQTTIGKKIEAARRRARMIQNRVKYGRAFISLYTAIKGSTTFFKIRRPPFV